MVSGPSNLLPNERHKSAWQCMSSLQAESAPPFPTIFESFEMKNLLICSLISAALYLPCNSHSQVPVTPNPNHAQMLASASPVLAANKQLVYDFWREVLEAGHMERVDKYLTESYIQHNPNVPTGRAAFVEFFQKLIPVKPIQARVERPLVSIVAEGDLVVLSFVSEHINRKEPTQKYTSTWFDMFRIENGKIAEHWDGDRLR